MTIGQKSAGLFRRVFVNQRRQSASVGAAVLGVLLLAGAALGTGIARTAVAVSDGLTWLGDDERGEVVQVNPASGRPETRLAVAGGAARLDIIQRDGTLVVLDRSTGQITVIDLATLLASGRRQAPAGSTSKVLLAADRLFIVDRVGGTIAHADPVTLADVGEPWRAGGPLADAVADDAGVLWAVETAGVLHTLKWSDLETRFVEQAAQRIPGAGPRTVLVPHRQGVTLLGLEGGVIRQDGTGQDHSATTAPHPGDVLAAQSSPDDLVPVAMPDAGVVIILVDDRVLRVEVADRGCPRPGRPAVFHDRVYVPCLGSGKVIVLDRDGGRGGEDVRTEGTGDPQLVFDDDRLFINTPGAERGVVVDPDGDTRAVRVRDPELPVTDPERDPPPTVPSPPPPDPDEPTRTRPNQPPTRPGGPSVHVPVAPGPPTTVTPTSGSSVVGAVPGQPAGITVAVASRNAARAVLSVTWSAPTDNGTPIDGYTVSATGGFAEGTVSTQTAATAATLTLSCGATFCAGGGAVEISVGAVSAAGAGSPGGTSWNLPAQAGPTTTARPTTTPPPPPTTTTPPPPPPTTTTTTTPPPPPPASVPTAGATVITGAGGPGAGNYRTVTMAPPADWAGHDGTCELINTTWGYSAPISCGATSAQMSVETGSNALVVRAHARDGSRSVDSAVRNVFQRDPEYTCPPPADRCMIPAVNSAPADESAPTGVMVAGGIGLLITSALLGVGGRRRRGEHT